MNWSKVKKGVGVFFRGGGGGRGGNDDMDGSKHTRHNTKVLNNSEHISRNFQK